jgi:aspartate/methionine/tyrosine aminotransferase
MKIADFKLERYFEKHEFNVKYILCASDCEPLTIGEVLTKGEMATLQSLKLSYAEAQGNPELRKEAATLYDSVTPEEVAVCVPEEGIFITMNALLNPGEKVIVQTPCYQALSEVPKAIGCKVVKWLPDPKSTDVWRWDINFLRQNVDKQTKMIIVNSPHNPTGHLFTKKEYSEIIEIANKNNCLMFSDEMYRGLEQKRQDMLPSGVDLYEKCISLSGVSKTLGLGGLRIGWLATREKTLRNKVVNFKDYTTISSNVPGQYIAKVALTKRDTILFRNRRIIRKNLELLDSFFCRHLEKFVWLRPKAGSTAFVKINIAQNVEDFCEDVIRKKSVMLMPSTKFDYGCGHLRLGLGRKNLPEALELFDEYLTDDSKSH